MNLRERFLATMAFEPVDRLPQWDLDYWNETLARWQAEGAPLDRAATGPGVADEHVGFTYHRSQVLYSRVPFRPGGEASICLDPMILRVPLNSFIHPLYEYRVIEEYDDVIVAQDPRGHIRRDKKDLSSISNYVRTLVENRADWERVKAERLALKLDGRLPANWPEIREQLRQRDRPLAIGGHSAMCGFYHTARYLLGPERLLYAFRDEPDLVHDILNHLADLYIYLFDQVLQQIDVDLAFLTEDIAFKTGPFISPATFREFLGPCYLRLTGMLRDHGVRHVVVDSDGNNWKLLPEFIAVGMTCFVPLEQASNMDPLALREAFPRLGLMGGIDKRQIALGPAAIDAELERKVPQVARRGGFIPAMDHSVPPDISWHAYVYYRQRLAALTSF